MTGYTKAAQLCDLARSFGAAARTLTRNAVALGRASSHAVARIIRDPDTPWR